MREFDIDLPIKVFQELDQLTVKHGVTLTAWAKATWPKKNNAGKYQSRLSEMRGVAEKVGEGFSQEEAYQLKSGGRRWTLAFCIAAIEGLKKLIGGEKVNDKLFEMAQNKKLDNRTAQLLMILAQGSPETEKMGREFLATLLRAEKDKEESG